MIPGVGIVLSMPLVPAVVAGAVGITDRVAVATQIQRPATSQRGRRPVPRPAEWVGDASSADSVVRAQLEGVSSGLATAPAGR